MPHDWVNDWMSPGVRVTFEEDGQIVDGVVRMVSHNAKDAIVAFEREGATVERTLARGQLTLAPVEDVPGA